MVRLDLGVTQLLLSKHEQQMPPAARSSGGLFIIPAQFHIYLFPSVNSLLHGYASLTVTALNTLTDRQLMAHILEMKGLKITKCIKKI